MSGEDKQALLDNTDRETPRSGLLVVFSDQPWDDHEFSDSDVQELVAELERTGGVRVVYDVDLAIGESTGVIGRKLDQKEKAKLLIGHESGTA